MSSKRTTRKGKENEEERRKVKGLERVTASLSLLAYADHFMGQEPYEASLRCPLPRVSFCVMTRHEFFTRAVHFRPLNDEIPNKET